jgi:hypothetical protein
MPIGGGRTRPILDVLFVPQLVDTLVSISHLLANTDDSITFTADSVTLHLDSSNESIKIGNRVGNLYYLEIAPTHRALVIRPDYRRPSRSKTFLEWHCILGHAGKKQVCDTLEAAGIHFDFRKDPTQCSVCGLANFKRRKIGDSQRLFPPTRFLHTVGEDLFDTPCETYYRHNYGLFIIDRYSSFPWVIWVRNKSDAPEAFIQFMTDLEAMHEQSLLILVADRGEMDCSQIAEWSEAHRPNCVKCYYSPADTQAFNGVTERPSGIYRARTISMLTTAHLPNRFYNFAMDYAIDIGRAIVPTMGISPFEKVFNRLDDYSRFHPFGCLVAVFVPKNLRPKRVKRKFHKAEAGIFLGYKGQRIILVYKFRTHQVHDEFHVRFCDNEYPGLSIRENHLTPFNENHFGQFSEMTRGDLNEDDLVEFTQDDIGIDDPEIDPIQIVENPELPYHGYIDVEI